MHKLWFLFPLCLLVVFGFRVAIPDLSALSTKYQTSQYCLTGLRTQFGIDNLLPEYTRLCGDGSQFMGNIDDPELYSLAGWYYVHGASPTAINFELQPLGKYLFGLSLSLGISPLFIEWLAFFGILILLYLLGRDFGLSRFFCLLPLLLFSLDPLVWEQLSFPYLDIIQTFFVLLFLWQLPKFIKGEGRWLGVILGLVALSKSFSLGLLLALLSVYFVFSYSRPRLALLIKQFIVSILVYLLGYLGFFLSGHSPLDFLSLHLTILKFYKSYVPEYPKGEVFRIIFAGEWRRWYGDFGLARVGEWRPWWPLGVLAAFITFVSFRLRRSPIIALHLLWVITYLVFLSLRLVFPRYLLPLLPSLDLFLVFGLYRIIILCRSHLLASISKPIGT